ncbi:MAG: hypothetical protein VX017_10710, partial [Pseudomonadota bacterium]|nr:hypothetical protein [Pseudomonadota bacterium]
RAGRELDAAPLCKALITRQPDEIFDRGGGRVIALPPSRSSGAPSSHSAEERVEELAGIPVVQQRVLFRGRQLFETIDVERRAVDETKTILQALRDGAAAAGERIFGRAPAAAPAEHKYVAMTLKLRGAPNTTVRPAAEAPAHNFSFF